MARPAARDRVLEGAQLVVAAEQLLWTAVGIAGIRTGPDLHRLEAEIDDVVEHLLERLGAEQDGEDAELHTVTHRRVLEEFSIAASTC